MKEKIHKLILETLKNLNIEESNFSIEHPEDFKNGDYSTNVAMVCAKGLKSNPKDLAEKIVAELSARQGLAEIEKIQVAGPGFINFYLSREFFTESVKEVLDKKENWGKNSLLIGKKIMVEYTDPNPFKPFHIGHLMTNAIGESVSRIVEFSGVGKKNIIRANYQGDVGPHVAKAIYGLMIDEKIPDSILNGTSRQQADFIGICYATGSNKYDSIFDKKEKERIDDINKQIYNFINNTGECEPRTKELYNWGRKATLDAFEEIYKLLGTKFNKDCYFFESVMAPIGEKIVRENVPNVFNESDGAIVFHGEEYDKKLHTRVFINSQGLPTYETKEIGLTVTKFEKENPDISIVVTATEQAEYMKVVEKAISLIHPDYQKRMNHITHGMMRFADGKMSSRKGNVITGESLLRDSMDMVFEKMMTSNPKHDKVDVKNEDLDKKTEEIKKICEQVGVGALKYSILKSSLGSDIIYDPLKSVSFEGDSGPYLQYTAVRANSILNKAKDFNIDDKKEVPENITDFEKYIYQFPEVVEYSYQSLQPHHIATYLTKLASEFNTFYGNTKILVKEDPEGKGTSNGAGNKYAEYHLSLIKAFYQTMNNGLWLLGIEIPERM